MPLKWAASLDQLWQTPGMLSLLSIAAALFFVVVVIIIALRSDKTVANGVLAVIALVASAGVFVPMFRAPAAMTASPAPSRPPAQALPVAALACLDGLAGDDVESACERWLFATPDMAAAAISYTASQISRLTPDDALTSRAQTPEGTALRRVLERDRFGLVGQVLMVREGCTPQLCPVFKILSDPSRIIANMNNRTYQSIVGRYAPTWQGGGALAAAPGTFSPAGALAAQGPPPASAPRPSTIDFPSADSTPAVSIMTGEPSGSPPTTAQSTPPPVPHAKPKKPAKKQTARQRSAPPVQLTPKSNGGDTLSN